MIGLRRTLRDRRGFTLVELVVVLVILGITASFAVPALTGYIDTSKEKKAVSEAQARDGGDPVGCGPVCQGAAAQCKCIAQQRRRRGKG